MNRPIHKMNTLTLFLRLFEAHILPLQLVVVLTASSAHNFAYPSFLMPVMLKAVLDLCSWCRLVSFGMMICLFYRYEKYHRVCVGLRMEEIRRVGLPEEMAVNESFSPNVFLAGGIFEAALFPVSDQSV